jgi:hypothetical protein
MGKAKGNMRTTRRLLLFSTAILVATFAPSLRAITANAPITWGPPTNISGDSDVSTDGTLVAAFNMNGPAVTVNGVPFASWMFTTVTTSTTNGNFTFTETSHILAVSGLGAGNSPFSSLSANYQTLLSTALSTDENNTLTLTMSGLTIGQHYQFEFFLNGSNSAGTDNFRTVATATNSVTLDDNTTDAIGGTGQFVIGTFTASTSQEMIAFNGVDITQAPTVNAFELRAVPEPTTMSILLVGGAILGAARTLRRKK